MKILCTLKRVPDPAVKIKFAGNAIDYTGMNWIINQFDEYAVEAALRLNENASAANAKLGETTVVSIGPKEIAEKLRTALAMGADRAILVEGEPSPEPDLVARVLHKIVDKEKPDLVLMGKLATDGEENQAGQMLAAYLGWPQATFAASIEVIDGGKALLVGREADAGLEVKKVPLPAVVTVDLRIVLPKAVRNGVTAASHAYPDAPRYPALKGIMAAKKKPMAEMSLASLGVTAGPKVKTVVVEEPPTRKAGVKVASVQELVDKLHNEAKCL